MPEQYKEKRRVPTGAIGKLNNRFRESVMSLFLAPGRRRQSSETAGSGSLYVLSSPAMPGLLKIGYSDRPNVSGRLHELSDSAGIPQPFVLEFEQLVDRPAFYAGLVHKQLAKYRVASDKEFFRVDVQTAEKAIRKEVRDS
jgi:hypothetical protein